MVRFITGGSNPTLAYCASTDEVRLLSAVAVVSSVATKLFSMAKSWWGGGAGGGSGGGGGAKKGQAGNQSVSAGAAPQDLDPKNLQPATRLPFMESLDDANRAVLSIRPDPQGRLAAVTDNLGRVLLVDLTSLRVVRLWKGYRQAQISWIEVMPPRQDDGDPEAGEGDDSAFFGDTPLQRDLLQERRNRILLYLAIYAPRRGLLEIWQMRQGARVAAFNVGTNCQLIQAIANPLGSWLGFTSVLHQRNLTQSFLLKQDGSLEHVVVPFHSSGPFNDKRQDRLLLKQFQAVVAEKGLAANLDDDPLLQLVLDMKFAETKLEALRNLPLDTPSGILLSFIQRTVDSLGLFHSGDIADFIRDNHVEDHLKADRGKWQAIIILVFHARVLQALLLSPAPAVVPSPRSASPLPPATSSFDTFFSIVQTPPYSEAKGAPSATSSALLEANPRLLLESLRLDISITKGISLACSVATQKAPVDELGNLFFKQLLLSSPRGDSRLLEVLGDLYFTKPTLLVCAFNSSFPSRLPHHIYLYF